MQLVILESPYAGDAEENTRYACACVRDCLLRGESPIASHLLFPQPGILDDNIPEERQLGINAGLAWRKVAEKIVVYIDLGISFGMNYGIKIAEEHGVSIEYRKLEEWEDQVKKTEVHGVSVKEIIDVIEFLGGELEYPLDSKANFRIDSVLRKLRELKGEFK